MVTGYRNYKVEIKNVTFTAGDGRTCPQTAVVTFFDDEGLVISNESLGAVDINLIYDSIKEGKDLILDNYYINEFSLSSYRSFNNLERKSWYPLKDFLQRMLFLNLRYVPILHVLHFQMVRSALREVTLLKGKYYFVVQYLVKGK